jgi:hypothetical protein
MMRIKLGGQLAEVVTIDGLATACGRSAASMRKYEERKLLPPANWRTVTGTDKKGDRIYTVELVNKLAPIFRNEIKQGVITSEIVKQKIKDLFTQEKLKYATPTT